MDVVVVHRASQEALARCLAALHGQRYPECRVVVVLAGAKLEAPAELEREAKLVRSQGASVEAAREAALEAVEGDWVCFLDEEDVPAEALLETLVRAQAASGADVVSCGLSLADGENDASRLHFFPGEPHALGLLANGYGTVALIRRSLLGDLQTPWPVVGDSDWPLLAGLSAGGARIVSVPAALVTRTLPPGTIERHPSDALLVVEQLERALPEQLRSLARLAAGLAADAQRQTPVPAPGLARRAARVLRQEGFLELGRRSLRGLSGRSR